MNYCFMSVNYIIYIFILSIDDLLYTINVPHNKINILFNI